MLQLMVSIDSRTSFLVKNHHVVIIDVVFCCFFGEACCRFLKSFAIMLSFFILFILILSVMCPCNPDGVRCESAAAAVHSAGHTSSPASDTTAAAVSTAALRHKYHEQWCSCGFTATVGQLYQRLFWGPSEKGRITPHRHRGKKNVAEYQTAI